jgi:hypothetical protein
MSSEWVAFACGAVVFGSLGLVVGLCLSGAPEGYEDARGFHAGKPPRRVLIVERQKRDAGRQLLDELAEELEREGVWASFRQHEDQRGA